jgi:uncharacterized membrane protein YeaQ/YmgE (transglycosylase-associated protein family)
MGPISWILVGLIAGIIANVIYPGPARGGAVGAIVLGILGAIIGGFLFQLFTGHDMVSGVDPVSIFVAVVGALALLFGYNALRRPRTI